MNKQPNYDILHKIVKNEKNVMILDSKPLIVNVLKDSKMKNSIKCFL